jgi:Holliday junction resolvase RusA-like endonuclease
VTLPLAHNPDAVELLHVILHGKPQGAARHRTQALVNKAGQYVGQHQYKQADHARYESFAIDSFRLAWGGKAPLDEPVVIVIDSVKYRPDALCRRKDPRDRLPCAVKPDYDNIAKIIGDALTKAGVVKDDARIVRGTVTKWLCEIDDEGNPVEPEHVEVVLKRWVQPHARTARGA